MMSIFASVLLIAAFVGVSSGQQCNVKGQCVGDVLDFSFPTTSLDCLEACQDTDGCTWYSFDTSSSFCGSYSTCDYVDAELCPACQSGRNSLVLGAIN